MASVYYEGMFEMKKFTIPEKAFYKKDILQKGQFWSNLRSFLGTEDVVCNQIICDHHLYKKGELVVINLEDGDDTLEVGIIEAIVVKEGKVFLVTRRVTAVRQCFGFYESETVATESTFTEVERLLMRGTVSKFIFVCHHHISFEYI